MILLGLVYYRLYIFERLLFDFFYTEVTVMVSFNNDEDGILSNIHPLSFTGTYSSPPHSFDGSDDSSVVSPSPFFNGIEKN